MTTSDGRTFDSVNAFFPSGLVVVSPLLHVERLEEYAPGWELQVRQARKSGPLHFALQAVHTPRVQIGENRFTSALLSRGAIPKGCVGLVHVQTRGIVNYQNETYRPGELVLVTPEEEIDMVIGTENVTHTVVVEARLFGECFLAHYGEPFERGTANRRFKLCVDEDDAYTRFIRRWMRFFAEAERFERASFDARHFEERFLHTLFSFFRFEKAQRGGSDALLLKRARELLHENLDMYLKINEMSEMLGVSQRTLEYAFKKNLGMTPKNYLQILRLHAAREELLQADPACTHVSDVAIRYAFFHMSHFAAEYKKLFGETPAQTLRR